MSEKSNILIITLLSLFAFFTALNINSRKKAEPEVKAVDVNVTAGVEPFEFGFIVHPEKRIPATNNWDTTVTLRLYNCSTNQLTHTYSGIVTDTAGYANFVFPLPDTFTSSTYEVAIEAKSHLNKNFGCQNIDTAYTFIDFSSSGDLLAGDTSVVKDNFINSLDLSNMSTNFYTNDDRNDLNQDTAVNSLDLSNLAYNFFLSGD